MPFLMHFLSLAPINKWRSLSLVIANKPEICPVTHFLLLKNFWFNGANVVEMGFLCLIFLPASPTRQTTFIEFEFDFGVEI